MAVAKARMIGGDDEIVQTAIGDMVSRIAERFQPHRIILFGSQARGTPNYHSDVDLLVVMENGTDKLDAGFLLQGRVMGRGSCLYDLKQSVGSEQAWDAGNPENPGRAGPRSSV